MNQAAINNNLALMCATFIRLGMALGRYCRSGKLCWGTIMTGNTMAPCVIIGGVPPTSFARRIQCDAYNADSLCDRASQHRQPAYPRIGAVRGHLISSPAGATSVHGDPMLKRVITTPDPYEPYLLSQGIRVGDLDSCPSRQVTATMAVSCRGASVLKASRRFEPASGA